MNLPLLLPVGPMELLVILVIVLLLFGATRLADIGKGLGEGIRNFKKGVQDEEKAPSGDGEGAAPGASSEK